MQGTLDEVIHISCAEKLQALLPNKVWLKCDHLPSSSYIDLFAKCWILISPCEQALILLLAYLRSIMTSCPQG